MSAIKKEVIIGDCRLLLGDCLDVMKELGEFDAVVTDPPYGTDVTGAGYGRTSRGIANDVNLDVCVDALNAAGGLIGDGYVVAFYSPRKTQEFMRRVVLPFFGGVVWDKRGIGMGTQIRYQHEEVAVYKIGSPSPMSNCFSLISVFRNPSEHPHQKPVEVMVGLIKPLPSKHILCPFMGTGSTGVACIKLRRRFTGVEINEDYFNVACKRIQDAYALKDGLFAEPKQESMI